MLTERGVPVNHTTILAGGEWCYLYWTVTTDGLTLDFSMSPRRNTTATTQFLGKGLRGAGHRSWNGECPSDFWVICTDKAPTYAAAIEKLIADKELSTMVEHRQVKCLNNVIEGDYGRLKRILWT